MIAKHSRFLVVRFFLLGAFLAPLIVGLVVRDEYEIVRTMVKFLCIDCIGLS